MIILTSRSISSVAASALMSAVPAAPVMTSTHKTEELLFSILIQLVIMIAAARSLNLIFRKWGQPGVIGEIVAGLLLGPSLFGHFFPEFSGSIFGAKPAAPIIILSQVGLILLMFQIGTNFEFGHLTDSKSRKGLGLVTIGSILVPFGLGIAIGHVSAPIFAPQVNVLIYSLFCGVALAITAVPTLGRILYEYGLNRHEVGVLAISAAAINDVIGWLMLATVAAFATASFTPGNTALQVGGVIIFGLVSFFILRPAAHWLLKVFPLKHGDVQPTLMAILLVFIFIMGMCTYKLGIFAIFGGLSAGFLFHHEVRFVDAWRRQVGQFVLVFFLPIFFTFTGLRTNVLGLNTLVDVEWLAIILAAATLGKIVPVYLAGRMSGYDHHQSMLLGSLMNTRALMELIVLNIGFEMGYIPQKVFTMLVIMAVVTTLMTGPLLKIILPRMGHVIPKDIEA